MPNYVLFEKHPMIGSAPIPDGTNEAAVEFDKALACYQNGAYQAAVAAFLASAKYWRDARDPGYQPLLNENRLLAYKNAALILYQSVEVEQIRLLLAEVEKTDQDCALALSTFCMDILNVPPEPGDNSDD